MYLPMGVAKKRLWLDNKKAMPTKKLNQSGFIPMLIIIILIVAVVIYLAYTRVLHAQQ